MSARSLPLLSLVLFCLSCASTVDRVGDEQATQIEAEMGLVKDAALVAYVNEIGNKLAPASSRPDGPWSFAIVDTVEPNAFALPGGHVWVSRGLLALVNTEDELAGVIGHEMGHVTADHARKRIGVAVLTAPITIATGLAGFATSLISPSVGGLLAGSGKLLSEGLVMAPRSRAQEYQADQIGQTLAAASGYDPMALSHFLHVLDREEELMRGKRRRASFLDTHPPSADRVARTRARATSLTRAPASPIAASRRDMLLRLDGMVVGEDPAQGVIDENRFLHPDLDLILEFPAKWQVRNTPQAVGAISPKKDALISLQVVGQKTSVEEVLAAFEREGSELQFERIPKGARTRAEGRGRSAEMAILDHKGDVYAIVGQANAAAVSEMVAGFETTVFSFRRLRPHEREGIRQSRLRVRDAEAGETPAALVERTGSSWSAEALAVANGVELDARFSAGQPVKVAMPEPYLGR
ncbi:MAG: M48 family metalloprotease [Myxococcota bacterium]|nr:M48 family metalloprotease [Myxococcota bacterium]